MFLKLNVSRLGMGYRTGNASGDDDDVGTGEGLLHAIVGGEETVDGGNRGDVGQVGGDTRRVDDIVQREVVDVGGGLEEQGERLKSASVSKSRSRCHTLL